MREGEERKRGEEEGEKRCESDIRRGGSYVREIHNHNGDG
jgi:hypothetical protein